MAPTLAPLAVAVIVTAVVVRTRNVVILKLALLAPTGICTVAGTFTSAVLALVRATTAPEAPDTVTVPVVLFPPTTLDDASYIEVGTGCTS